MADAGARRRLALIIGARRIAAGATAGLPHLQPLTGHDPRRPQAVAGHDAVDGRAWIRMGGLPYGDGPQGIPGLDGHCAVRRLPSAGLPPQSAPEQDPGQQGSGNVKRGDPGRRLRPPPPRPNRCSNHGLTVPRTFVRVKNSASEHAFASCEQMCYSSSLDDGLLPRRRARPTHPTGCVSNGTPCARAWALSPTPPLRPVDRPRTVVDKVLGFSGRCATLLAVTHPCASRHTASALRPRTDS